MIGGIATIRVTKCFLSPRSPAHQLIRVLAKPPERRSHCPRPSATSDGTAAPPRHPEARSARLGRGPRRVFVAPSRASPSRGPDIPAARISGALFAPVERRNALLATQLPAPTCCHMSCSTLSSLFVPWLSRKTASRQRRFLSARRDSDLNPVRVPFLGQPDSKGWADDRLDRHVERIRLELLCQGLSTQARDAATRSHRRTPSRQPAFPGKRSLA